MHNLQRNVSRFEHDAQLVKTEMTLLEAIALGRDEEIREMHNRLSNEYRHANRQALSLAADFEASFRKHKCSP